MRKHRIVLCSLIIFGHQAIRAQTNINTSFGSSTMVADPLSVEMTTGFFADASVESSYVFSAKIGDYQNAPNSYIYDPAANVINDGILIPVKKAFSIWQNNAKVNNKILSGKMTATVYWQDVPGLIRTGADYTLELLDDSSVEWTKIKVPIDKSKGYGNAVIALHIGDAGTTADPVVWSWHVWVTDDPGNGPSFGHTSGTRSLEFIKSNNVSCTNCYDAGTSVSFIPKYMDRNLGATDVGFSPKAGSEGYIPSVGSNRSGGLMFQWGRKDPMPPLVYKDGTFYDVIGEVGTVRARDVAYKNDLTSPSNLRIFQMETSVGSNNGYYQPTTTNVKSNIENSISYPLKPIYNTRADQTVIATTWFAGSSYDNLWSDNSQGTFDNNGHLYSHAKGYLNKSPFDPCPNQWRIPSKLSSRKVIPINFSPFGQNITATGATTITEGVVKSINLKPKGFSTLNGGADKIYNGAKIFPNIGFDLSSVGNPNSGGTTNMGLMPGSGAYLLSRSGGKFTPYFSDYHQTFLWTATIGNDNGSASLLNVQPGQMVFTPDPRNTARPDMTNYPTMIGSYAINFTTSEVNETQAMNACRCMQDPYADSNINPSSYESYDFPVDYLPLSSTTPNYYSNGLSDPNSYLLVKSGSAQVIGIPIRKAFSVYNNYLSDHELPSFSNLKVNVHWTTEPALITNIKLDQQPVSLASLDDTKINVTIGSGKSGNAVISLHDGNINNPVLWSWHIWVANTDPTSDSSTITYTTERDDILETDGILQGDVINYTGFTNSGARAQTNIFMDRNLGALDALPTISSATSTDTAVQNSGGLQYQWGRKDPIPTFLSPGYNSASINSVVGVSQNIFRSPSGPDSNGNLNALSFTETVTSSSYKNSYAKLYDAFIKIDDLPSDTKEDKIKKHLRKSVQNPFSFIHQNIKTALFEDWLLDEPNAMSDRWGHAAEKSPFDPCPDGWRVPDSGVQNVLYNGSATKGLSPWYFGNYNPGSANIYTNYSYGVFESAKSSITQYGGPYPGIVIKNSNVNTSIRYGVVFGDANGSFKIGNIPYSGIRGLYDTPASLGNFALAPGYIGLWTSSLNENYQGGANSLQVGRVIEVQTKVAADPYLAMNVRCVKTNPVINSVFNKKSHSEEELPKTNVSYETDEKLYPIPFREELHINSNKDLEYSIYDMRGALITSGRFVNKKAHLSHIIQGVYIIKLTDRATSKTTTKKIIKN